VPGRGRRTGPGVEQDRRIRVGNSLGWETGFSFLLQITIAADYCNVTGILFYSSGATTVKVQLSLLPLVVVTKCRETNEILNGHL